jgi:hypothetical protein
VCVCVCVYLCLCVHKCVRICLRIRVNICDYILSNDNDIYKLKNNYM